MTIFHLILLSHLMTYIHFIEFVFFLFFSPKSKTLGFFPVSWRCVIFQNGSFTGEFTLCFFLFIFALTSLHSHHEFHSWKKCNISSFFFLAHSICLHIVWVSFTGSSSQYVWVLLSSLQYCLFLVLQFFLPLASYFNFLSQFHQSAVWIIIVLNVQVEH